MGTNCAPLVADLFLFCYERDFMMYLSDNKQADIIDAFNTTSRYLDDILNINNVYFDTMVSQIYPSELQLNKANTSDTKVAFLDLHLSIYNGIVLPKFIISVTTLILKLSISHFYMVMFLALHHMESISLNSSLTHNKLFTQKLIKQGFQYHKLHKIFSKLLALIIFQGCSLK